MGMTVDKTIEFFNGLECHTPQAKDAREVAISTMRKYQKIEQIINYPVYIQEDILRYKMICEVVGKKNITHGTYEGENRGGN